MQANRHFRSESVADGPSAVKQESDAAMRAIDKKTAMLRSLRRAQEAFEGEAKANVTNKSTRAG